MLATSTLTSTTTRTLATAAVVATVVVSAVSLMVTALSARRTGPGTTGTAIAGRLATRAAPNAIVVRGAAGAVMGMTVTVVEVPTRCITRHRTGVGALLVNMSTQHVIARHVLVTHTHVQIQLLMPKRAGTHLRSSIMCAVALTVNSLARP